MINCLRPSNRSSRLTLPLGPSNSYFFSTATHGIRRRSAASASRERVKAFSFTRSCWRAGSHSCCGTIGGLFIAICPFGCSLSLSLLVAIALVSFFGLSAVGVDIWTAPFVRIRDAFPCVVLLAGKFYGYRCQPAGRDRAGHDKSKGCETEWAHRSPPGAAFDRRLHLGDG